MANPPIYATYPPPLSDEQKGHLVFTVKNWSIEHGLAVRPNPSFIASEHDPASILATNAPVTLFPSPFPRRAFENAQALQGLYNELYARIADDEDWLEEVLKDLISVDDFVENLWKCHLSVKAEGYTQNLSLGLFRSDYMLDSRGVDVKDAPLKQVEFNTISSSFGGLAAQVTKLHTHLLGNSESVPTIYPEHPLFHSSDGEGGSKSEKNKKNLPPPNQAVSVLAKAMADAHVAYGPSKSDPPLPLCIVFLVQPVERNIFDQLALSAYIEKNFSIPVFRLPVSTILKDTSIPKSNPARPLVYTTPWSSSLKYEATIVYFRALYAPSEYDSAESWTARTHLERSAAIKCPTVLTQLAGTKKVQQVLTLQPPQADHLRYFLPKASPDEIAALRASFAPQYSLAPPNESSGSNSAVDVAAATGLSLALDPSTAEKHVLKPQREGGGNNIYKSDIPSFLESMKDKSEYKRWVLMEMIQPPPDAKNVALRSDGEVVSDDVISELGIFGGALWEKTKTAEFSSVGDRTDIKFNTSGGYLLRTKGKENNEGGVAAGFSSLDSVLLY